MSLIKKLAGETAIYGLSSIVGRTLNFFLTPLYTRALRDTADYGIVTELYAMSAFLAVLFTYRMESAFFRYGSEVGQREKAFSTAMQSLLLSTAVLVALMMGFSNPIASAMDYGNHADFIRLFALMLAFDGLSELPFALLRLEQRPKKFVFVKLAAICSNIVLNLFWLVACPWLANRGHQWVHHVWSADGKVGYIFLSNAISSGIGFALLLSEYRKIKGHFDRIYWRQMMRYALPLVLVGFAGIVNEMLDRSLMPYLLTGTLAQNRAQLGIYGANYKLAMIISLFTQAYRYAAEPFFFRHGRDHNALQIQADTAKWYTIVAAGGMLAVLLFLDLIKWFLGERYQVGVRVVPILLVANVLLGLYYNFSVWYRLKDKTSTGAVISIAGALVTIILLVWWTPLFGYFGAAWATLCCYLFMSVATWFTGRTVHPVPYELGKIGGYIAGALLLWGGSIFLKSYFVEMPAIRWVVDPAALLLFIAVVFKMEKLKWPVKG